tara:strand:+ start:245 stop:421 length:177 start_codon:yes stop_codon:yes gene_type:complete
MTTEGRNPFFSLYLLNKAFLFFGKKQARVVNTSSNSQYNIISFDTYKSESEAALRKKI